MACSCIIEGSTRGVNLSGDGIAIEVACEQVNHLDWLFDIPPTSFGQIQHLVLAFFCHALPSDTLELPLAAFENLKVLQFHGCPEWFADVISRTLNGEGTPCRSLREILDDYMTTGLAQVVQGRGLAWNRGKNVDAFRLLLYREGLIW